MLGREEMLEVLQDRLQLALHLPLGEQPTPHPSAEGVRCPHVSDGNRGRSPDEVESKERLRAPPLASFPLAERIRRGEIHDFKLRQPRAKARLEAGANVERALGFNRAAAREPLGYPGRVAEEGEDPVDRGADVVDERMANGSHPIWLLELAHQIYGNRRGLTVQPQWSQAFRSLACRGFCRAPVRR